MSKTPSISITHLIFVPAVITLAITILRLVGELQNWSPGLFSREAGGGFALIGISWLPIAFGIYFAMKLADAGERPQSMARVIVFSIIGFVILMAAGALGAILKLGFELRLSIFGVAAIIAGLIQASPWPALFRVNLAYALAARIPVAILMWVAMVRNWGTHYDVAPPGFSEGMGVVQKFLWIGLLPQMTIWLAYTIIMGGLFGGIYVAVTKRKPAAQTAEA